MDVDRLLSPRTEDVVREAGFVRRALAFIVDILVLDLLVTAPLAPLFAALLVRTQETSIFAVTYTPREMGAMIVVFLIAYAYFAVFEYLMGQTPGMMVLNVRTTSSLWQSLVRNSFLLPVFPFIVLWIIEPIAILFSGRGILERLSNTHTVFLQRIII